MPTIVYTHKFNVFFSMREHYTKNIAFPNVLYFPDKNPQARKLKATAIFGEPFKLSCEYYFNEYL